MLSYHPCDAVCCLIPHAIRVRNIITRVIRCLIFSPVLYGVLPYHPCDTVCYFVPHVIRRCQGNIIYVVGGTQRGDISGALFIDLVWDMTWNTSDYHIPAHPSCSDYFLKLQ